MIFENAAALDHRRHRMFAECPDRPRVARRTAQRKRRAMHDGAALSYSAARGRCDDSQFGELERVAIAASKVVSKRVLRELLAAATVTRATPRHLTDVDRFVQSLAPRSEDEQLEWVALYKRLSRSDKLRHLFLTLTSSASFLALPAEERSRLARYVAGPSPSRHAHPDRAATLSDGWVFRATAALRFVDHEQGALDEFLLGPTQPMHLLRTLADVDLLVVVFGDPNAPRSLSYGRFFTLDESGHPEASIVSPDPRIASRWRSRDVVTAKRFECRTTFLTRLEERSMIDWLETNHVVTPDPRYRPRLVPYAMFSNARTLHSKIEATANLFASVRGPLAFTTRAVRRGRAIGPRRAVWTPSAK